MKPAVVDRDVIVVGAVDGGTLVSYVFFPFFLSLV